MRAIDLPGRLEIIGEVRAGERFAGQLAAGQAVEIMTGAPIPSGADAVVMIEHTRRENGRVVIDGSAEAQQFINPRGCEAAAHQVVVHAGKRLDYADIALLASFGTRAFKFTAVRWSPLSPPATKSWKSTKSPRNFKYAIPTPIL